MNLIAKNKQALYNLFFVAILLLFGLRRVTVSDGVQYWRHRYIQSKCNLSFVGTWKYDEKDIVINAVESVAKRLAKTTADADTPCRAFRAVYGITRDKPMEFHHLNTGDLGARACGSRVLCIFGMFHTWQPNWKVKSEHLIIHELGHAFELHFEERAGKKVPRNVLLQTQYHDPTFPDRAVDPISGKVLNINYGFAGVRWLWQLSDDPRPGEEFADMYLGWTHHAWANNAAGNAREAFMDSHMPFWVAYLVDS